MRDGSRMSHEAAESPLTGAVRCAALRRGCRTCDPHEVEVPDLPQEALLLEPLCDEVLGMGVGRGRGRCRAGWGMRADGVVRTC